jgi:acetolactate synthase-1/3 small subunit
MMVTVAADAELRSRVTELASIFEAKILDVGFDAITLMAAGTPETLDAVEDLLRPIGIVELQRTGRIALPRLSREAARVRSIKRRSA